MMKPAHRLSILLAALGMVASPAFAAPTGDAVVESGAQSDIAESYRKGVAALDEGDIAEGERLLSEVLAAAPRHAEANYFMGAIQAAQGKNRAAARYFRAAIAERATFTEAREKLALTLIEAGDRRGATAQLSEMRALLKECGNEACGEAYAGRLEQAVNRVEAALSGEAAREGAASDVDTRGALLKGAGEGAARYRDSVRLLNQAQYQMAIDNLLRAQGEVGPHPDILNYLGFAHRKLGRNKEAKRYYKDALRLDPNHRGALEYLGELHLELGELEQAQARLARLEALCPFGCAEREDLARLLAAAGGVRSAAR